MRALVIPVTGRLREVQLDGTLGQLQSLVGGNIEALPLPAFIAPDGRATAYVNDEGKFTCEPNMRATDFLVPGVGLLMGDWVAGPLVLCGFDPESGENRSVPAGVVRRARLIERKAGVGAA